MTDGRNDAAVKGRGETADKWGQARELLFSCLCSFVILLFCTRSSPLYVFNNWDDVNSYFSVGKGMMNGLVPYRDLFDQKGILLYFLYGLAYLISHTTFIGVFLLELAAASLHLWAVLKLALLLCGEGEERAAARRFVWPLLPLYGACVYGARCVWYGGSAEELMLPVFAWGLWLLLRTLRPGFGETEEEQRQIRARVGQKVFLAGLLTGCVLHIKFNSLGFFLGWIAIVILYRLRRDGLLRSLTQILRFLLGMGAATLPWFLYFLIHRALYDWFRVTIWLNLFIYSEKLPFAERWYSMLKTLYYHFLDNPGAFVPAVLGLLWFLALGRVSAGEKCGVVLTGGFLALGIFIGGVSLPYYPLPLAVYALFAIPAAASLLAGGVTVLSRRRNDEPGRGAVVCVGAAALVCGAALIGRFSLNPPYLRATSADLWQYRFRDDIAESGIENPTLLNMNCFDVGLYCVADIVPNCYFFQTQTIRYYVYDAQRENLHRGDTDFVVAMDYYPDGIREHYQEIDRVSGDFAEIGERTYFLFQKVD